MAARVKRSLPRRIVRWFVLLVVGLLALVGLLLGFLQTPWGKDLVRTRIEAKLGAKLNGSITIGSIDYSLLFRDLELHDVVIRDSAGRQAVAIGSLSATLDRMSVIDKAPVIEELTIAGLEVTTAHLDGIAKSSSGGTSFPSLVIERLSIAGNVTIEKPDGTRAEVRNLAVSGSVRARPAAQEAEIALRDLGATTTIVRPGKAPRVIAVSIATISVRKRADAVDVELGQVMAGAVTVNSIAGHLALAGKELVGIQSIKLAGVHVENSQLAALVGHDLLRDDATVDVSVVGPVDKLVLHGDIKTGPSHLTLAGTADLTNPLVPRYDLLITGTDLQSGAVVMPGMRLPFVETSLRAKIVGSGITRGGIDARLALQVTNTTIGSIRVEGLTLDATADDGALRIERLHAVAPGLVIDGSGTFSADRVLDGALSIHAAPPTVVAMLADFGIVVPRQVPLPSTLDLAVKVHGRLEETVAVEISPTTMALAGGRLSIKGRATLEHKKLATANVVVGLRRLDLGGLARLAGKKPYLAGSLSGSLTLSKDGAARSATYDLVAALPSFGVDVSARGSASRSRVVAQITAARSQDRVVVATAAVNVPLTRRAGEIAINLAAPLAIKLDVSPRPLGELAVLLPASVRALLPAVGDAELHVDLQGTGARLRGTIDVDARAAFLNDESQRVKLRADVTGTASGLVIAPRGSVWLRDEADPIGTLEGEIKTSNPFARGALDVGALAAATVDAKLTLAPRSLAALAWLRPELAKVGGTLDGHIAITGPVVDPRFAAALIVHDVPTADSATHDIAITADGTTARMTATVAHGDALKIVASMDRSTPGRIVIDAHASATKAPLRAILPAFLAPHLGPHSPGVLDWDMTANVALVHKPGGFAIDKLAVTGTLDVSGGEVRVPDSKRIWRNIRLSIASEPNGLRLRTFEMHESDREIADRVIRASGFLTLERFTPQQATLALTSKDWLLSTGSKTFGMHDAPRATLDADIAVVADLRAPILAIDATINALALNMPERFNRAHQYENASLGGDIIYTDGGVGAGKLPYVAPAAPATKKRRGYDVRVHMARPIFVQQPPLELEAKGDLTIKVRDEGVTVRGALDFTDGKVEVMGNVYRMVRGSLALTDEHPKGDVAVTFEHPLPPAVQRELSRKSIGGGGGARIVLSGSPVHPAHELGGANNAGLVDAMSINTVGHPANTSAPDLPASEAVNLSRQDPLQILSFMAQNLPHLLVLDRITAYANPQGAHGVYGRITNVEAERYAADQRSRVRVVVRPPTPGRSDAELQYDRLLINNGTTEVGIGVRAGDRAGGGIGVFLEWSSD